MKATSGNHTPRGGQGAGDGCNNQKSRFDTLRHKMKLGRRRCSENKGFGMGILTCRNCIENKLSMPSTFIEGKHKTRGGFGAVRESYSHETRFGIAMVILGLAALVMLATSQTAFALNPLVVYTESSTSTDDILNYSTFSDSWSSGATAVDANDYRRTDMAPRAHQPDRQRKCRACHGLVVQDSLREPLQRQYMERGRGGCAKKFGRLATLPIWP